MPGREDEPGAAPSRHACAGMTSGLSVSVSSLDSKKATARMAREGTHASHALGTLLARLDPRWTNKRARAQVARARTCLVLSCPYRMRRPSGVRTRMPNAARRRPRPLSDLAMSLIIRSPHSLARSHSFLCTRPTTAPAVAAAALVSAAAAAAATDASARRALPGRALPPGFEHESPPLPRPGPNHSLHPCPPHCPCHKHLLPLASSRARDTGCEGGREGGREGGSRRAVPRRAPSTAVPPPRARRGRDFCPHAF